MSILFIKAFSMASESNENKKNASCKKNPLNVIVIHYQLAQCSIEPIFSASPFFIFLLHSDHSKNHFTDEVKRFRIASSLTLSTEVYRLAGFAIRHIIILLSHTGDKYYCKTLSRTRPRSQLFMSLLTLFARTRYY